MILQHKLQNGNIFMYGFVTLAIFNFRQADFCIASWKIKDQLIIYIPFENATIISFLFYPLFSYQRECFLVLCVDSHKCREQHNQKR